MRHRGLALLHLLITVILCILIILFVFPNTDVNISADKIKAFQMNKNLFWKKFHLFWQKMQLLKPLLLKHLKLYNWSIGYQSFILKFEPVKLQNFKRESPGFDIFKIKFCKLLNCVQAFKLKLRNFQQNKSEIGSFIEDFNLRLFFLERFQF